MRKPVLAVAATLALLIPGAPSAQNAACCQLTTSLAQDTLRGQDLSGDERFFVTEGAPPNIHFLIDTSGSMNELVQHTQMLQDAQTLGNAAKECGNPTLNLHETSKGWSAATAYPIPDPGTGLGSDNGFPNLFQGTKYYRYMSWYDGSPDSPAPLAQTTAATVCSGQLGLATTSVDYATCQSCLNTRGYYIHKNASTDPDDYHFGSNVMTNRNRIVFTGNYLNFNPPKYVTMRSVLKQLIKDLRRVRAGYSIFNSGGAGGVLLQGQNPSCDQILNNSSAFDNNRASYINGINGLAFAGGTPLAESLFNIGQYFSSSDAIYTTKYGFSSTYLKNGFRNGALTSQGRSICWGCQVSSVVILTDGLPTSDTSVPAARIATLNGGPVICPDYDGNGLPDCGDSSSEKLDDVAKFLATHDLQERTPAVVGDFNTAGQQSLLTYGIGFGLSNPILHSAADVGGGEYHDADDAQSLKAALTAILSAIQTRATSFSAASVASFQINRSGGSLLPRFKPERVLTRPREGFLYRFELGTEEFLGCDPTAAATRLTGGPGDPRDFNADGDCDDVNLIDATGRATVEDADGNFVYADNPTALATPLWEAGRKLKQLATPLVPAWRQRSIWTVVDNSGDGKIDKNDTPIAFTEANAATLMPYLGIANDPAACGDLANQLGISLTAAPLAPTMDPLECARIVIRWYRGANALAANPADRLKDRPFLLHDIFHSAPVLVDPPLDKRFCGLTNQCIETLYGTETPLQNGYGPSTAQRDAYDEYLARRGHRSKLVLVGSNGGMLHAFHGGTFTGSDPESGLPIYDAGTGREVWALIPPDMLPKLKPNLGKHGYFVDSSPMIREIWADGAGSEPLDGQKQPSEFRTLAVVGSGTGGVHRFAIDLTDLIGNTDGDLRVPNARGDFLWMWPQPCDPEAMLVGDATTNFSPKPPPIGAVAIRDDAAGPLTVDGVKAREQWVVFFNGGYDKYLARGRMMAMVNAWTGGTLWSFRPNDGSPNSDKLLFPIAAGIGMMDIGRASTTSQDYDLLFDTATVGDYGGQLWTVRFWRPGEIDATSGRVTNWYAARALQTTATGKDSGDADDATATGGRFREPFAQVTSNAIDPKNGSLHTYLGTGDRNNLTDAGGPHCRLSNLGGCVRQGCTVGPVTQTFTRGGTTAATTSYTAASNAFSAASVTTDPAALSCTSFSTTLSWRVASGGACTTNMTTDPIDGSAPPKIRLACTGASCTVEDDWVKLDGKLATAPENTDRFYAVAAYGGARVFNDAAAAATFDTGRLDDRDLTDVTATTARGDGSVTGNVAAPGSLGWMIRFEQGDERTGSGTALLEDCVLWNSFQPGATTGPVCSNTGTNTARFYQANFASGAPNCAASFLDKATNTYSRNLSRTVVASPGDPAPQLIFNGGMASSTVVTLEAGNTQGNTVAEQKELLQSVYQIAVDQKEHQCRHEGAGCP